ncbi:MAG: hypothetical protein IT508_11175 [Burkholderiaceae bacterium]|nr:hypothetical protein [Burkholderiaceae bacterium]
MSQAVAISIACVFVGALCVIGAIDQVRTGETWGATGKGRVYRASEPGYFWYVFAARIVLGPIALAGGLLALQHL